VRENVPVICPEASVLAENIKRKLKNRDIATAISF